MPSITAGITCFRCRPAAMWLENGLKALNGSGLKEVLLNAYCTDVYICLLTYPNQFLFMEERHSCVRCFFTVIFFWVHIVYMCVRACKNATVLE